MVIAPPAILEQFLTPSPKTDSELLLDCVQGDERAVQLAWESLVQRHYRRVFRVPRNMGISKPDAEDITQESFVALYQRIGYLYQHQSIIAWLCNTAHKKSVDFFRSHKIEFPLDDSPCADWSARVELQETIYQAFKHLSNDEQMILRVLLENPKSTDAELAEKIGKSEPATTKVRQRAFGKLREHLKENASKF